jgi:uncharacterized protein
MSDMQTMPADAVEVTQGERDFYVPQFEVFMAGRAVPKDVVRDVTQVTYKDNIKELDSFEITINNWDAETRAYKYSDSSGEHDFDPGQRLMMKMGYFGQQGLTQMIEGEITQLRPSFPASGASTLQISGLNILHRLRKKQNTEAYTNTTDLKIAEKIAKRMNLDFRGDQSPPATADIPYVMQDNQYDIIFLMERARRIGYEIFVENVTPKSRLAFVPSTSVERRRYDLKYGKSLIQFSPTLTTKDQVNKVTVRGWDPLRKQPISETVTRAQLRTRSMPKKDEQMIEAAFDREEIITNRPVRTKAEAQREARAALEHIVKDMITGSGSTVGIPDLRAGSVVYIRGVGERFSGRYFVTSSTHTINDSGYTTQFEARREEDG